MSETSIRLQLKEVNDSDEVILTREDLFEDTYTLKNCGQFTLIANSTYKSIDFGNVTTGNVFLLNSDRDLKVKINGSTTEITMDSFFFRGEITSLDIRNTTSNVAKITYEVYET